MNRQLRMGETERFENVFGRIGIGEIRDDNLNVRQCNALLMRDGL